MNAERMDMAEAGNDEQVHFYEEKLLVQTQQEHHEIKGMR